MVDYLCNPFQCSKKMKHEIKIRKELQFVQTNNIITVSTEKKKKEMKIINENGNMKMEKLYQY